MNIPLALRALRTLERTLESARSRDLTSAEANRIDRAREHIQYATHPRFEPWVEENESIVQDDGAAQCLGGVLPEGVEYCQACGAYGMESWEHEDDCPHYECAPLPF